MRKITLLFVIGLTSLVVMACSFGGIILQNTGEPPADVHQLQKRIVVVTEDCVVNPE